MKQIPFLTLMIALIANTAFSQTYQYEIDLQNVVKDRVKVTLVPPPVGNQSEVTFVMPAVIPGSYSRKNYGRFINKFPAFDSKGNELKVDDKNDVDFIIYEAADLAKIEYWVDDTWDDKNKKMFVFQPGGSNIEAGKNFVLNHHAFFGYFNGMQKLPFEIKVKKPKEMYGSTYLKKEVLDEEHDILKAPHYNFLVDNPAMYCVPDTLSFMVGQSKVVISV